MWLLCDTFVCKVGWIFEVSSTEIFLFSGLPFCEGHSSASMDASSGILPSLFGDPEHEADI